MPVRCENVASKVTFYPFYFETGSNTNNNNFDGEGKRGEYFFISFIVIYAKRTHARRLIVRMQWLVV
jgi:hypothetical protein